MIVVKVELWPHGDETRARELGRMTVALAYSSTTHGDYQVSLTAGRTLAGVEYPARNGSVWQHERLRLPVWALVSKALRSVGF